MAQNTTLVALSQMVDLSLNVQEGVINFQVLHTLLHIMIQQLSLNDVAVEFRGPDSDKIQSLISGLKSTTQLTSSSSTKPIVKKTKKKGPTKRISLQDVIQEHQEKEEKTEEELRVIERRKDSKDDPELHPLPLKSPPGSLLGVTPADLQTVVVVESQSSLPQYSVAVSKTAFDDIQKNIEDMKEQIKELRELPGNMGLLEATRSNSGPIVDMFQILNLTKRMDATETALEKVGSLLEDVVKGGVNEEMMEKMKDLKQTVDTNPETRKTIASQIELRIQALEKVVEKITNKRLSMEKIDMESSVVTVERNEEELPVKDDEGGTQFSSFIKPTGNIKILSPVTTYNSVVQNVELEGLPANEALAIVQEEFRNLMQWMTDSIQDVNKIRDFLPVATSSRTGDGIGSDIVDNRVNEMKSEINELNALFGEQIGKLNGQLTNLQADVSDLFSKLQILLPGGDNEGINAETTLDLANKFSYLEQELVSLTEQAAKLQADKEEHIKQTSAILEQIDLLKIIKANREDLEDALGDKADACMINRKVSHDQFDAACDDLSRGIEEALTKLEQQEEMWKQTLDAIQREVGNKLDKMEVDPLRDFVNSKLRSLQEKFKSLTALKREQEAAGTKMKLLRDVNCISCDKDVVMRREMDPSLKPKAYAMPPSRNMAPYLAYELDQLRKQQKCVPGSKNLNFIENALKSKAAKNKNHLCNRYCGGSHTVTTPQQRVTRLGHFLEQWGPEIEPLQDKYIRGNDNHMYKIRDDKLYGKVDKQEDQQKIRSGSRDITPLVESELPQQDTGDMVNPLVQEAIANDASATDNRKKVSNIGSIPLTSKETPQTDENIEAAGDQIRLSQGQARTSQVGAEQRASQGQIRTSHARLSQEQARTSQTGAEQRLSQAQANTEQRMSQGQARTSQAGAEQRPSLGQVRTSQAGSDQRASQGQARTSQAGSEQRASQGQARTSQVAVEQRMSQGQAAVEPRVSQGQARTSQGGGEARMSQGQARTSQAGGEQRMSQGQARVSQGGEARMSQGQTRTSQSAEPRVSQTQEPKMSQASKTSARQSMEAK